MRIADGDPVKLARMLEIQSWFDNKDQLAATATSVAKYLQQSEKVAILPEGVAPEYIELLLWAMEQTDSPNPIARERWWEYRSQMEHPPEIEGSSIYRVPFVRVFIDRTQLQEEKSSWPDDASSPSSPSPFTSSHGAAVCRRGIGGDRPPSPIVGKVVNCQEEFRVVSICRL